MFERSLVEAVEGLLLQRVNFDMEHTEELRGRRVLGFVARDKRTRFSRAMPQFAHTKVYVMKQVIDAAMAAKGRPPGCWSERAVNTTCT